MPRKDAGFEEAFDPKTEGAFGDRQSNGRRLSRALPSPPDSRPSKEGKNRSGRSRPVAVIEMIRRRVVEVDGELDEPQP